MWHRLLTGLREPSTPEQRQVVVWASILFFLVLGSVAFYYSFQAPPEKMEVARQLRNYGFALYAVAGCVYGIKKTLAFFLD